MEIMVFRHDKKINVPALSANTASVNNLDT